jgi:hypothetical protein
MSIERPIGESLSPESAASVSLNLSSLAMADVDMGAVIAVAAATMVAVVNSFFNVRFIIISVDSF